MAEEKIDYGVGDVIVCIKDYRAARNGRAGPLRKGDVFRCVSLHEGLDFRGRIVLYCRTDRWPKCGVNATFFRKLPKSTQTFEELLKSPVPVPLYEELA